MEKNKILQADLLDILFDDRNKSYGAYELRRTYSKRIAIALSGMFITVAAIGGITMMNEKNITAPIRYIVDTVNLSSPDRVTEKPLLPPPPPPKPKPVQIEITKFTPPIVIRDDEVKKEDMPPEQEILDNTKIGALNVKGDKTDVIAPPVETGTGGHVVTPKVEEEVDIVEAFVQIEAKYPGGSGAWYNFLKRNLRSDVPLENGASSGKYTVLVSFIVDRDGNTSEIKAETDPGYGCAAEAIRVIKSSGKWQPAEQNGHKVIYRQKQAITFEVQDN
ncbi:MAG: energy transducer TonB [Chitinophagaceae bacterium]|jgi:protein TonB|nr:energy transducer TonB [Chitinophagaceae bacterium]